MIRAALIWGGLGAVLVIPLILAGMSPYLAWRDPIYIIAGCAGIIGMGLALVQPVLLGRVLPGLTPPQGRRLHRWVGAGLVAAVVVHVAGLWITSPPDVVDVLLLRSPTPFSVWGFLAMWAVLLTATLAVFRKRLPPKIWRRGHGVFALVVALGTTLHAALIDGTMEPISKVALSILLLGATVKVIWDLRIFPFGKGSAGK